MSQRPTRPRIRLGVAAIALALGASVAVSTTDATAATGPFASANDFLSSSAPSAKGDARLRAPRAARASRLVSINSSLFSGRIDGKRIGFKLLPGVSLTGRVRTISKQLGMRVWYGEMDNKGGYFYAARSGSAMFVHIAGPKGVFEVSNIGGSTYRLVQINQGLIKDDAPRRRAATTGTRLGTADAAAADSRSQIDVMVAYSNNALTGEGSIAALKARIATAVAEANGAYAKSGVTTRLRLVHIEPANYNESGSFDTDLTRLQGTSDGYMDGLHATRNVYAADVVVLAVENEEYCGLAAAIMANAASAFAVVNRGSCMTGYYSFAHEIGHLQGARHDTYVDPTSTPYSYGHGYVDATNDFRTVMAYADACGGCTRVQYFSNPAMRYNGHPTGTSSTKNYLVLNNTALTVANFRTARIAQNFNSTFNGSATGWVPVAGTWHTSSVVEYSSGLANTSASIRHVGLYGDSTFTIRAKRTGCVNCANWVAVRGTPVLGTGGGWKPSYVFQWTNNRLFSIYLVNTAGTWVPLLSWRTSTAIKANDWNVISVRSVDSALRMFINGVYVGAVSNSGLRTGVAGFGFYRDAAAGAMYVDSAVLSTTPQLTDTRNLRPHAGAAVPGGTATKAPR